MMGSGVFPQRMSGRSGRPSWRQSWTIGFAAGLCLLGLGMQPCFGQFTGPSLSLPTQPNTVELPTNDPALLKATERDIRLGFGDVLTIHLFGSTDFNPVVKVTADGTVQLPLVGVIAVAGLTVEEVENLIAQRLVAAGYFNNPQVLVELTAAVNQYATITGEIHAVVPLYGIRRLFDVLAAATPGAASATTAVANISSGVLGGGSGWPSTASHVITIFRQGVPEPIVINIGTDPARVQAANIVILPHDLIVIAKVGVVYVLGAFQKQGAIPLDQNTPLTLMQATALSGGAGYEGRYEDLRLIRTEGLERKVVKVDIKRIQRGQDPDPILQADDIVFLPTNIWKATIKNGGISTLIGLVDIAVIALVH